jgi:hypothetical protein
VLRRALLGLGIVAIVGGLLLIAAGAIFPVGIDLLGIGVILTLALVFERRGYRPRVNRAAGRWEKTNERFIDPVSGHVIVVMYNSETGERDYVDTGESE